MSDVPQFDFETPLGYFWLLERGLIGFEMNSQFQPWHYLPARHVFELTDRWPLGPSRKRLVAFAKRQDNDDLACFEVEAGVARRVLVVHGWTDSGYDVEAELNGFWEWLKLAVDDMQEWIESIKTEPRG
jgi:hypothetical protein